MNEESNPETNEADNVEDCIAVSDRASRRRFIRSGSAFFLGGATLAASITPTSQALANDCDRGGSGEEKPEQAGNGSDNDTGSSADPAGCGRHIEPPKISRLGTQPGGIQTAPVAHAKVITVKA